MSLSDEDRRRLEREVAAGSADAPAIARVLEDDDGAAGMLEERLAGLLAAANDPSRDQATLDDVALTIHAAVRGARSGSSEMFGSNVVVTAMMDGHDVVVGVESPLARARTPLRWTQEGIDAWVADEDPTRARVPSSVARRWLILRGPACAMHASPAHACRWCGASHEACTRCNPGVWDTTHVYVWFGRQGGRWRTALGIGGSLIHLKGTVSDRRAALIRGLRARHERIVAVAGSVAPGADLMSGSPGWPCGHLRPLFAPPGLVVREATGDAFGGWDAPHRIILQDELPDTLEETEAPRPRRWRGRGRNPADEEARALERAVVASRGDPDAVEALRASMSAAGALPSEINAALSRLAEAWDDEYRERKELDRDRAEVFDRGRRTGRGDHVFDVYPGAVPDELLATGAPRPSVESVAFSPDGRFIATGTSTGATTLWATARLGPGGDDGIVRKLWNQDDSAVRSVAFSPDGRFLASGSDDGVVRIWDARDGSGRPACMRMASRKRREMVFSVAFSPDGRTLAAGTAGSSVEAWDVDAGGRLRGHRARSMGSDGLSVAFSPDGRRIVAGSSENGAVSVIDSATLDDAHEMFGPPVQAIAYSMDGSKLAAAGGPLRGSSGAIHVWDLSGRRPALVRAGDCRNRIGAIAFSSARPSLFVTGDESGRIYSWDMSPPRGVGERALFAELGGYVRSLAFSPDGLVLAAACGDGTVSLLAVPE